VLGCCGVVVGVFTFTEARPAEISLIDSLAAIAFALPVMRNALPGSPPLGVEGITDWGGSAPFLKFSNTAL
jgi:Domain of unknown function (DUF4436)